MAYGDGLRYENQMGLRREYAKFLAKHRVSTVGAEWQGQAMGGGHRFCHTTDLGPATDDQEIALERGDICLEIQASGTLIGAYIAKDATSPTATNWLRIFD